MLLWLYQYLHQRSKPPYVPQESAGANRESTPGPRAQMNNLTLNKREDPSSAGRVSVSLLQSMAQLNSSAAQMTLHSVFFFFLKSVFTIFSHCAPAESPPKMFQAIVASLTSHRASHRLLQADRSFTAIEAFLRRPCKAAEILGFELSQVRLEKLQSDSFSAGQDVTRPINVLREERGGN